MNIKLSFLICFLVASDFIYAKNTIDDVEIGQIWSLETRSNKLSVGNSKVLYFFSNDAYNTYQARILNFLFPLEQRFWLKIAVNPDFP